MGHDDGFPLMGGDDGFPLMGGDNGFPLMRGSESEPAHVTGFRVSQGGITNGWLIEVWGKKDADQRITLRPVEYVTQPEYWLINIEAVSNSGAGRGYDTFYLVQGIAQGGTKGITLAGRELKENVDVPPGRAWGTIARVADGGNTISVG